MIKPKKSVSEDILKKKKKTKQIILRIEKGEEVVTTVVHLSEVANIENLLLAENVKVLPVSQEDYLKSLLIAKEKNNQYKRCLGLPEDDGAWN